MRRYKAWLLVISLPVFALSLAACGSSDNNKNKSPTNTPNAAVSTPTVAPNGTTSPTTTPEANATQPANPAAETEIDMVNNAFQPQQITVTAGTTVTWKNQDSVAHTVTSGPRDAPSGLFDSGQIAAGGTFSFTFTDPGTYEYYCTVHPGMDGTVTVTSAG